MAGGGSLRRPQGRWYWVELGRMVYDRAHELQKEVAAARRDGRLDRETVLAVEHPPVFTLGRRGGLDNLTVSREVLDRAGIPVAHAERGGDITYHGPGQIVLYPIVRLGAARLKVVEYVQKLETVMMRSAADWGVSARRDERNRGIWVGNHKLGSIGIAIQRGVSLHGLAFNVDPDLTPFGWINPCGLQGIGITSLGCQLKRPVGMENVMAAMRKHMESVFDIAFTTLAPVQLREKMGPVT